MPADPKEIHALRQKAEKALSEAPEKLAHMSWADLQKLVHELSVHQIELEMQSEELHRSLEQLEESRNRYAEFYDFAPVGYLTFDKMGLITEANLTICGLLGIGRNLLIKAPFAHFIHPESQDLFYFHSQKVLETTTGQTCELVLKRKNGTFFDAQLLSIVTQVNGQPAVNSVVTDITARKQAEEALQESNARLKLALASSHMGVWEWNAVTNEVFWPPECSEIIGSKSISGTFESFANLLHPEDVSRLMAAIGQLSMDNPLFEEEFRTMRPDGGFLWVEDFGQGCFDGAGALLRVIGTVRDITREKRAEDALRASESKFRAIAEDAPDIVAQFDHSLRYLYVNRAVESVSGRKAAEFIGKTNREAGVPRHPCEAWDAGLTAVLETGQTRTGEFEFPSPDKLRFFQFHISPQIDPEGTVISAVSVTRDITELKETEADLKQSEADLFTKGLELHEMNTALRVLLEQREKDTKVLEERIIGNVKTLVSPHLSRLRHSELNTHQATLVDVIDSRLNEIISPFMQNLSATYRQFTPKEIEVATFVRDGRTTKEIAEEMGISLNAVDIHRAHLRQKCGLVNKKVNLRSYLLSLAK